MADFDLSVRYENQLQKVGFASSLVLLPFWAMIFPSMLGMSLFFISQNPAALPLYAVALVLLGLSALIVAGFFNSAVMEDDRLNVTAEGIAYPPIYLPRLRLKTNRPWNTLTPRHCRSAHAALRRWRRRRSQSGRLQKGGAGEITAGD
jgi:hypothetical protein